MTSLFDSMYSMLLEMPMSIGHLDRIEALGHMKYRRVYDDVGEFSVGGLRVEVLMHSGFKRTKPFIRYEMVNNEKVVGLYQGKEVDRGVITSYAQTEPFVKGESLMYNFYIKFLLKKYSFVISDDSLSDAGFNFYYKNFDKFSQEGYKIDVIDEKNKILPVNDKEELKNYWGSPVDKPFSGEQRFRISKK